MLCRGGIAVLLGLLLGAASPAHAQIAPEGTTFERVRVPMRDGVELSVEIWRPAAPPGGRAPVLLHLTPYHAMSPTNSAQFLPLVSDFYEFAEQGYALAFADVRGTWGSGGCWDYGGAREREDGYDLVEWLGTRDWSSGKVAMIGASYPGTTANAAAVERPPHLATIVAISAISRWWGYAFQQGSRSTLSGTSVDVDPPLVTPLDFMFGYGLVPPPDLATLADAQTAMRLRPCDRVQQAARGYLGPQYDAFWQERDYLRRASQVEVPVLVTHGLQDYNVKTWEGTAWFEALEVPKALVLGQWGHASPRGSYDAWEGLIDRWLARWLKGEENGVEEEPPVHVQSSDGTWHRQAAWGRGHSVPRSFPLGAGPASWRDDGLLTETEVVRGLGAGVRWARIPVAGTAGVRISGRPVLRLKAASSTPGPHLTGVLCDIGPDGACTVISRAFMDARYRRGLAQPAAMVPGEPELIQLEFIDKDWTLAAGHSLELRLASTSLTWTLPSLERPVITADLTASDLVLPLDPAHAARGVEPSPPLPAPGEGPNDSP